MEHEFFHICGLNLCIQAERPLRTGGDMLCFQTPAVRPDLIIDCRAAAALPLPEGEVCRRGEERLICRRGTAVARCQMSADGMLLRSRVDYDLTAPDRAVLTVRSEDWHWITDYLRLWSTVYLPQLLLPFRTLVFHASYIGTPGGAVLFTAPSGTGKSTQAELWRVHRGARVLNGDKAAVRLDGAPMAHGMPFSGTSGICENVSLPLRGIVVLSQAKENTVRRLGPSAAAAALSPNLFADQAVAEEWHMALNLLLDLAASVPVYALACTPDERAVSALEQAMARDGLISERT